ncbi:MAG: hypothetical protein ACYTF1_14685 [Planctomycetota bacterium]|jgi:hypothetical protein
MKLRISLAQFPIIFLMIILGISPRFTIAATKVLGAYYRADQSFSQFRRFWHEGWNLPDEQEEDDSIPSAEKKILGGSIHVFVRNDDSQILEINDVLLEGISLKESIVFSDQRKKRKPASIYFGNLTDARKERLITAGEPVWWRIDPPKIEPGGSGEVIVRLRQMPQSAVIRIGMVFGNDTIEVSVPIQDSHPRVAGVSFSPDLDMVYLYFRHPDGGGRAPAKILMDGREVKVGGAIQYDSRLDTVPVIVQLEKKLKVGSFHCFQGMYDDKLIASAGIRAWSDDFAYGMWGGKPGNAKDSKAARSYVAEITDHNINVQMPQLGSSAVQEYYKSAYGKRFCRSKGLRKIIDQPGKWGEKNPFLYFIHDEPDCGDYLIKGLDWDKKVGALAQWAVQRSHELRAVDPTKLQLLNLDMTFKPRNWYIYGQLPDVLSADPYYQARIRQAYRGHPERVQDYVTATYIYVVSRVCQSACEPKPLHIILYSVSPVDEDGKKQFRFPTPQEKRIEVYYALAAGAKGISYWWYTPSKGGGKGTSAYGVGAASGDSDPEAISLMREIGLLGAEVRTAGPLIVRSCPIEIPIQVKEVMRVNALLSGADTMIFIAVNEQYANDRVGTVYRSIDKGAAFTIDLPRWLKPKDVFEINFKGVQDIEWQCTGSNLKVELDRMELTRMVVATADADLRNRLSTLYKKQFSSKVTKLLSKRERSKKRTRR